MSDPRIALTGQSAEIVDRITGPFLLDCVGMNDLAVVNGLMTSAAIMIKTHCDRTGDDVGEISNLARQVFDLALYVACEPEETE
jgi:hypothetical protein